MTSNLCGMAATGLVLQDYVLDHGSDKALFLLAEPADGFKPQSQVLAGARLAAVV